MNPDDLNTIITSLQKLIEPVVQFSSITSQITTTLTEIHNIVQQIIPQAQDSITTMLSSPTQGTENQQFKIFNEKINQITAKMNLLTLNTAILAEKHPTQLEGIKTISHEMKSITETCQNLLLEIATYEKDLQLSPKPFHVIQKYVTDLLNIHEKIELISNFMHQISTLSISIEQQAKTLQSFIIKNNIVKN